MTHFYTREDYEKAAGYIRSRTVHQPRIGLILGSGLNSLAEAIESAHWIPYEEIPNFPRPTVEGHVGRLGVGSLEKASVIVMQGRVHFYEGYSMQQVVFPVRVMQVLGIEILIVTNAAGGINPEYHPGDLMLISDHINLIGMTGNNPLHGPNDATLGPRFPDMSQAYDLELRRIARTIAREQDLPLREGVYIGLSGPSFETPADIRFLRLIGADAVGMSTVPEVTVARHGGIRVMGLSGITNVALSEPTGAQPASHEEVLAAGRQIVPRLTALIRGVLGQLKLV
jgi:purine-nucleoside phosphorylase